MTPAECEVVADAGTRLKIITDGLYAGCQTINAATGLFDPVDGDEHYLARRASEYMAKMAEHLDDLRSRLAALPLESEGEAA